MNIKQHTVIKQLDNVVFFGSPDVVNRFYKKYKEIFKRIGVICAPVAGDKCFALTSQGVDLGIHYDTKEWSWKMPEKKAFKLVDACKKMVESDKATIADLKSLVGRITFYSPVLGQNSHWERAMIISASNQ